MTPTLALLPASLSQSFYALPWVLQLLILTSVSLLFLAVLFRPLEVAFPARPGQALFRPKWFLDLCFFLGQYLLWSSVVFWVLVRFGHHVHQFVPAGFRAAVAAQPLWLQGIEVIFFSDFFVYWGHRLQHRTPILWRFHRVHHSAEHLDWLAAHREHPVDTVYTMGLINLPAFVIGFPIETLALLIGFRGLWAIYIHSNVRLPIPWARWLIGAPELHHWHHDKDRDAGNYANISPLMDLMFGTYTCPDHEPASFGIHEPSPKTYAGHMVAPFLPEPRPVDEAVPEVMQGDAVPVRPVTATVMPDNPGTGRMPQASGISRRAKLTGP